MQDYILVQCFHVSEGKIDFRLNPEQAYIPDDFTQDNSMQNKLEPPTPEIRRMFELTTDKIVDFLDNIDTPVKYNMERTRAEAIRISEKLPECESSLKEILDDLFQNKILNSLPTAHPGFMAYIPGGGIIHAGLAELIAKVANRYVGIDATAPFLSQVETDVLKWFCKMVGYPDTSGGTLTSGGSIANLTAVICARTLLLGDDFSKGTVYASGFVHHSMWKAFHAAGIASSQIRNIPVDDEFRLNVKKLEQTLQKDREKGFTPLMIIATAGSTNTGTVDPLMTIAEISKKFGAWYHIDAAYGGFFTLTDTGKKKLPGIELADSITLDPHKGLFLPYGTGAFIVRDRAKLRKVFSHDADYIPDKTSCDELWDFSEMSLELTRPFRGLAVWLPFKLLGAEVFRKTLDEKLELANYFYQQLCQDERWEVVTAPELSLTVFRYSNPQKSTDELNSINREIIEHINHKGRVNLSATVINNKFVIRNCILSFRTHRQHVDWLLEDLDNAWSSIVGHA